MRLHEKLGTGMLCCKMLQMKMFNVNGARLFESELLSATQPCFYISMTAEKVLRLVEEGGRLNFCRSCGYLRY